MNRQPASYAPGANPPGLRSPNWVVLKTWHRVETTSAAGTFATCGQQLWHSGQTRLPKGARYCARCKALDVKGST